MYKYICNNTHYTYTTALRYYVRMCLLSKRPTKTVVQASLVVIQEVLPILQVV